MQRILNLKVKYRESFRPFAPSVRIEDAGDWFDLDRPSPTCCWSRTSLSGGTARSMTAARCPALSSSMFRGRRYRRSPT